MREVCRCFGVPIRIHESGTMFTGIVEATGTICHTRPTPGGRRLRIDAPWASECRLGASVSVSGVCLTVADADRESLEFDVIRETLDKSTLGAKRVGDRVNLERSLGVGDRLDGHFVQGHVDGIASVERVWSSAEECVVRFEPEAHLRPYIIPKGSIAIDGVSLTIASVEGRIFSVALIPTTLDRTTFSSLKTGDRVNIESDIIARTIVHHLSEMSASGGLTLETLREAGFA